MPMSATVIATQVMGGMRSRRIQKPSRAERKGAMPTMKIASATVV